MKRTFALSCIVLFALTGLAHAQEPDLKVGVFDPAIIFEQSNQGRQVQAGMNRLAESRYKEMNLAQNDLINLQQELRNKELTFNADRRAEMQQFVNQKQIELQRMNDDANRELKAELAKAEKQFRMQLLNVVEVLGRDGQYMVILQKELTLYTSPDVEITGLVLDKFNEMYPGRPEDGAGSDGP